MANYAIIENNVCTNVVVSDASNADASWVLITDANIDTAGVGATYDAGTDTFTQASVTFTADELEELAKKALVESDWSQLPDVGLTTDCVNNYKTYRATLRQIKDGDLGFDDWPDEPAKEYV